MASERTPASEALIFGARSRAAVAIPAKIQNDLKQFQRLQLDLKHREVAHTLEELKTVGEDATIYRPIGGLMIRAKGRKEVEDLLTEEKETLEVRVKALERQEGHLRERYTTMQQELSQALQAAGVSPTGAADE